MPKDLSRWRVSVISPRPGRDYGEWTLRVRPPGASSGKRERTELEATPENLDRAKQIARTRAAELNGDVGLTALAVYDRYTAFMAEIGGATQATLAQYRSSREHLLNLGLGGLRDGELTRGVVTLAKDKLRGEGRMVSTVGKVFGHFSAAWRWAYHRELVEHPWPQTAPMRVPRDERNRKLPYTDEEVYEALEHFRTAGRPRGHYFVYAWAIAETGARADAVAQLQGMDVAFLRDGTARISLEHTKTGTHRHVFVGPALAAALPRVGPEEHLFTAPRRGGPLDVNNPSRLLRDWLKAKGLFGKRDPLHSFRRTVTETLQGPESGVSVQGGMAVTGHESVQVFASYASRGRYDTRKTCELLWLDPLRTQVET